MEIARSFAALLITLGLLGGTAWLLRAYAPMWRARLNALKSKSGARLLLKESTPLGGRAHAHLLEADGQTYLIVTTPEHTTVVPHNSKPKGPARA